MTTPSPKLPEVDFLYEEGAVMVVNKPAGILTQAPPEIDSMEFRLKRLLKIRDEKPGKVYLGVPHRLDRPVSGAMVFAKNVRATRRIAEQFEYRSVVKKYWAIVEGTPDEESGEWIDYMRKIPGQAKSEIVADDHPDAQLAILKYRCLQSFENQTLLEIKLETGRTHQIRIQCSSRMLPVVGDFQYDAVQSFGEHEPDERKRRIALHARYLKFEHPISREMVAQTAPLTGPWNNFDIQVE